MTPRKDGRYRFLVLCVASFLAVLFSANLTSDRALGAERMASSATTKFSIPAQPLRGALDAFSAETNIQVLYDSNLAMGRTSGAVVGDMSSEAALVQLLAGTGLQVRFTNPVANFRHSSRQG